MMTRTLSIVNFFSEGLTLVSQFFVKSCHVTFKVIVGQILYFTRASLLLRDVFDLYLASSYVVAVIFCHWLSSLRVSLVYQYLVYVHQKVNHIHLLQLGVKNRPISLLFRRVFLFFSGRHKFKDFELALLIDWKETWICLYNNSIVFKSFLEVHLPLNRIYIARFKILPRLDVIFVVENFILGLKHKLLSFLRLLTIEIHLWDHTCISCNLFYFRVNLLLVFEKLILPVLLHGFVKLLLHLKSLRLLLFEFSCHFFLVLGQQVEIWSHLGTENINILIRFSLCLVHEANISLWL